MNRRAVAISGAAGLCAAGMTMDEAFAAMLRGERDPQPPLAFQSDHTEPFPVFEIRSPLPGPGSDSEFLRTTLLAFNAAAGALLDAGLETGHLQGLKVGVCIGTTVGSAMNNEEFYREFRLGTDPPLTPILRYLRSNPAAALARHYGFDGPCQVVVNACSSGTDAIGLGAAWIRSGLCDIALVGGADELCRTTYNGFVSLMITDRNPCRPFDLRRRGLNLGEGAGVMVLESRRSLELRGKAPRGYVLGYGSSTDAYHLTAPDPQGLGLRRAVNEALMTGGVPGAELAFINAHGTGTPDNDRVESRVLYDLFPTTPFLSTKGYTGHTLGAAGAIEAVLTLASLERGMLPGTAGFAEPDPDLPTQPAAAATPLSGRFALSESLAFGGNNSAVLLGLEVPECVAW
jgi:3-oxoacyl-[acyl-carrier-protein] synthase-1/3-oxoacyl-[acyl-carrier-protein] synthase II